MRELRVQVGKGGLLVKLQYFWDSSKKTVNKNMRVLIQKKMVGGKRARERERDTRGKLIPVDPFGMPSFFL